MHTRACVELRIRTTRDEDVSSDALSIRGYDAFQSNSYHLVYLPGDNFYYVVSPKDVVVAKPFDLDCRVRVGL